MSGSNYFFPTTTDTQLVFACVWHNGADNSSETPFCLTQEMYSNFLLLTSSPDTISLSVSKQQQSFRVSVTQNLIGASARC